MIWNERQYKTTLKAAKELRASLSGFEGLKLLERGLDPLIVRAQRQALISQLADLERDLEEYRALQSGESSIQSGTLAELGELLIQARIAKGITQQGLAERLGLKPQQIQRYEVNRYASASLARLSEVSDALGLDLSIIPNVQKDGSNASSASFDMEFDKSIIKEAVKRQWISHSSDERIQDVSRIFYTWFSGLERLSSGSALHKRSFRRTSTLHAQSLCAWEARILEKGHKSRPQAIFSLSCQADLLGELREVSCSKSKLNTLPDLLGSYGISIAFERHLPKTYVDGAAFWMEEGYPLVGMSLRYDRLDNFWFVLMHELAHIFLHMHGNDNGHFVDEELEFDSPLEGSDKNQQEIEANEFALAALIPSEIWENSLIRFAQTEDEVVAFANRCKVSPSVVAGRLRRERGYQVFTNLIGQGEVRNVFERQLH